MNQSASIHAIIRGRTPEGAPNPIDIHIGKRIRLRRQLLGLTQDGLAELLGITFQQVQKYEKGLNRVSCSRLWDIAQVLKTQVPFFFDDMTEDIVSHSPRSYKNSEVTNLIPDIFLQDPMQSMEILELVHHWRSIKNRDLAEKLKEIIFMAAK